MNNLYLPLDCHSKKFTIGLNLNNPSIYNSRAIPKVSFTFPPKSQSVFHLKSTSHLPRSFHIHQPHPCLWEIVESKKFGRSHLLFTKPEQYCSQRPYRPLPPHSSSSTSITFKIIFSSYFLKEKFQRFWCLHLVNL
jgi:hypothetical protein